MDRPMFDASQITDSKQKWTCLVQVIERRKPKKSDGGPLYRNYTVTDTKGTKVPIVMFDGNVAFFANSLQPFKRYYISNAVVKQTPPAYRVLEYPYTWTLHRRILVEPCHETIPTDLPCTFPFDKFSDFYQFADQDRPVCIKALVIHALPIQDTNESTSIRDFVVIDEEMIPMMMRVWDDLFVETEVNINTKYKIPTLIVAYGLKVTTHNGLSLGTKTNAYFLHNPPLKEKHSLKEWYAAHATDIKKLLETRCYRDTCKLFHPPRTAEIMPLDHALASIGNVKAVWTEGNLTYLPAQDKLWFEACEKCLNALDVDTEWKIWCPTCQELTNVTVRGTMGVFLSHETTVVEATIKSPDIKKLIPFTPTELRLADKQNTALTKEVAAAIENKHVVCFLKYYDRASRGNIVRRYPVVKMYTKGEVQEYHANQHAIVTEEPDFVSTHALQHIAPSSSAPQQNVEKEFFTPTTKTILEEISKYPSLKTLEHDQPTGAKRTLAFQQAQPTGTKDPIIASDSDCLSHVAALGTETNLPSTVPLQTTPPKKSKLNKEKT